MHSSSLVNMEYFTKNYLHQFKNKELMILDIGSNDVNGTYKHLFDFPKWKYIGLDMVPGKNVDVVIDNLYHWKSLKTSSFDVIISGQTFEHIEFFWLSVLEVTRLLKPMGYFCLIVPSSGHEHRYPVDCWRFFPDGLTALAKFSLLNPVEAFVCNDDTINDEENYWKDSVLIACKSDWSLLKELKLKIKQFALNI